MPKTNQLAAMTDAARAALGNMLSEDVVRTQLLQSVIIAGMDDSGLLDVATMQGGSCIAGCYGGQRLSEDLDFEIDELPTVDESERLARSIEAAVRGVFAAEVRVKELRADKLENPFGTVPVGRWLTRVEVVSDRPDIPHAVVKLEIAKVPHLTSTPRRYSNLAARALGVTDTVVMAERVEEIIADKVVSLLAEERFLRVRDVWDLSFLMRAQPVDSSVVGDLTSAKIGAYGFLRERLRERIPQMRAYDWPQLLPAHLEHMLTTDEARRDVVVPRRALALADEALDMVEAAMR